LRLLHGSLVCAVVVAASQGMSHVATNHMT
jgi:hypothetical protein